MLKVKKITKFFVDGNIRKTIINIPYLSIPKNKSVIISGYSGSGKTTFLNLVSGLLLPDEGDIYIDEVNITKLKESNRDIFRANNIGYIFQDFKLFAGLSVLNNVMLGASFGNKFKKNELNRKAVDMLKQVGLHDKLYTKAGKLSGGEKQRVAIARSLINTPKLILADEPTGNLDNDNSDIIIELLLRCVRDTKATLLVTSHALHYKNRFDICIDMKDINKCSREGSHVDTSAS